MSRRLFLGVAFAGLIGIGLTGCPDNPYSAKTWTKKLGDPREAEAAVTHLEQLGNPDAIEALGTAWQEQGKPPRLLQVIIGLARPLTPEQAKATYMTDFETSGRPASWDKALPFLTKALSEVDEANPRSVDSAQKAADAIGEAAGDPTAAASVEGGLDPCVEIAQKPFTKKLISAQVSAIRAIGKYTGQKQKAAAALQKIIDRDPPDHPRTAKDKEQGRALEEKYGLFLGVNGAAINALADLRAPTAVKTLVLSMYRTPELFTQVRRALVASGPSAEDELRKILRGEHAEVNTLFKDKKLDTYCGDKNDYKADQCQPVSAKDFYPAVVLGDFYDPKSVPDLLVALGRPALPQYYSDDQPSGGTQYNAIFDALRKIGAADAESAVHAIWSAKPAAAAPAKGAKKGAAPAAAGAAQGSDLNTKILAISAYPFLARDSSAATELAALADAPGDNSLRQEAATAFARLSTNPDDIKVLLKMSKTQLDAAAKQSEAAAKEKAKNDAADAEYEKAKKAVDDAKAVAIRATHDTSKTAADIKAAAEAAKNAEDALKDAKKKHRDLTAPYKAASGAAKDLTSYAHMFETHIARIAVAMRCKNDSACYAKTLTLKPEDAVKDIQPWVSDVAQWSKDEKAGVVDAEVERAMLEIGKQGAKAAGLTDTLLDAAKADDRLVRQSILLALPKIAKVPCSNCEAKLDVAIKAGEGKSTLGDLNLETTMLRNYFAWAGGKTPSAPAAALPSDTPAPAAATPAPKKTK